MPVGLEIPEDPKGIFGGDETIETVARLGLAEDMPKYMRYWRNSLDRYGDWGRWPNMGGDPAENARIWVDENQALQRWLPDEELASAERAM